MVVQLSHHSIRRITQYGFTYLGLLFFIAIMGILMMSASTLWSVAQQREKERELLFVGLQVQQAIARYYERSPGSAKQYPHNLNDLLKDSRYLTTQRYLRKIYTDPMTNSKNWGLVIAPSGGIIGVYSQSQATPIKSSNFLYQHRAFEQAKTYADWKFVHIDQTVHDVLQKSD